jgi:threonine dehydrogenase-like Zn-dependent dehydrogenase
MKALVYLGNQKLVVREEPAPTPADGEAIILMRAAAICGSELGGVKHNDPSRKVPLIMGHEFVGVRADTGQLVAVNPLVTCGTCDRCLADEQNLCRNRSLIGVHRSGGFAEEVAVPIRNIYELPAGTSVLAAVLIEPLANAWHLWHLSEATPSSRIGIIGGGAIGLMTALVAMHSGAQHVTLADVSEARRGTAIDAKVPTVVDYLEGEFDVIAFACCDQVVEHCGKVFTTGTLPLMAAILRDVRFRFLVALRTSMTRSPRRCRPSGSSTSVG